MTCSRCVALSFQRLPAAAAIVLLVLSGCAAAPEGDGAASPSAEPTTTDTPPAGDRAARAKACADAAMAASPLADAATQMKTVVSGCLDVYSEPGCKDAMRKAIGDGLEGEERLTIMSEGCGAAYCPKLPAPKPEFCEPPAGTAPGDKLGLFGPLRDAILELELGAEGKKTVLDGFELAKRRRSEQ